MLFKQHEIDQMSDVMKHLALRANKLPECEIACWFINESDGPQFFSGTPPIIGMQPLYFAPAKEGQQPVAWRAKNIYDFVTQDRAMYRADIEWQPLYLARE